MGLTGCEQCDDLESVKQFLQILKKRVKCINPSPGEIPILKNIDIYGVSLPKNRAIGGDHMIYIDFSKRYDLEARIQKINEDWEMDIKEFSAAEIAANPYIQKKEIEKNIVIEKINRNKTRAGVLVADVKGHDESAAFIAGMLHQAFLTGSLYELSMFGNITTHLFEIINTRFYNSSSIDDFLTMLYGEISEEGNFKFITAGHPKPVVFSNEFNRLVDIRPEFIANYPPIGVMPSADDIDITQTHSNLGYKKEYRVHEIHLMGKGDILLLYTDGLMDHSDSSGHMFFPRKLEEVLKRNKTMDSRQICRELQKELAAFAAELEDDITYVVIKKT